jgi:chromosome-anchoring protein RacA
MELKTSNVAKRLGVSPKTVQRWVKKYNIPCQKNEAGHYVFDAETLALLEQIKFEHGAALEEFDTEEESEKDTVCPETFFATYVQPQLDKLTSRLQHAERKLEQKADEVVSFQLLQHRQEIEELTAYIHQLEQRLAHLEQTNHTQSSDEKNNTKKPKRRGFSRIMSLFA